ncbi:pentapeptide repeat-containing protein [Coleofasciculus sp. F4-SAH-05]|uniref:pentapeptide repeat-containing protein n=1 Tax=Coleofasciculus sp. F4-SAH-05 TaxID=3069525 RepID=UPI0032F0A9ED
MFYESDEDKIPCQYWHNYDDSAYGILGVCLNALTNANLANANLSSANLSRANLRGANLQDTYLWGAALDGVIGLDR